MSILQKAAAAVTSCKLGCDSLNHDQFCVDFATAPSIFFSKTPERQWCQRSVDSTACFVLVTFHHRCTKIFLLTALFKNKNYDESMAAASRVTSATNSSEPVQSEAEVRTS